MQPEILPETPAGPARPTPGPRLADALHTLRGWWSTQVVATVNQAEAIARRRAEGQLSARFLLMVTMSAGIAILGLLLSSPAVVIGAMLLSPLMDPIMGVGFALAVGDYRWLRQAGQSLAVGVLFAILFCALVVFLSPLQSVTPEIAARTRPNLFDLLVAVFSAIAGAYAMIRGREGTIVGVAIATALMPPLAVVGFGLATLNSTVFWGALGLFLTNLTAIALTATAMARAYGFRTSLSERGSRLQNAGLVAAFVGLAVPLGVALQAIAWESQAQRIVREELGEVFAGKAQNVSAEVEFSADTVKVSATIYTNELFKTEAVEAEASERLRKRLERPTLVRIMQIESADARDAQRAQLGEFRRREAEERERAMEIAQRLAILAGVPADQVLVDRERRRAVVRARPLDGATLAAYAELEQRIGATEADWDIRLIPPLLALPVVRFAPAQDPGAGEAPFAPDAEGRRALALIAWAQERAGVPVRLEGPGDAVAAAGAILGEAGLVPQTSRRGPGYGDVAARWSTGSAR